MDDNYLNLPLDLILENLPAVIFWMDSDLNFQGCNKETLRLFELESEEEFVGRNILTLAKNLNWPEGRALEMNKLSIDVLSKWKKMPFNDVISRKNGEIIHLYGIKQPIFDVKIKGVLVVGIPNKNLRNNTQTNGSFLNTAINPFLNPTPESPFSYNSEKNLVLSNSLIIKKTNQAAEKLFDKSREQLLGKSFSEICEDKKIISLIQDHFQFILSGEKYELEEKLLIKNQNGESLFKIKCEPIASSPSSRDIYDSIMLTFALLTSESNNKDNLSQELPKNFVPMNFTLRDAFNVAEVSFSWMNKDQIYLGCNPWTCKYARIKNEGEFTNRNVFDIFKKNKWSLSEAEKIYEKNREVIQSKIAEFNIDNLLPQGADAPPIRQATVNFPILNDHGETICLINVSIERFD